MMKLQSRGEHPLGVGVAGVDAVFTTGKRRMFAFHGYPWLIHRLTYRRTNHDNLHVRGYKEEGTTTTPFDMCVLNDIDRFHLVLDVIRRLPQPPEGFAGAQRAMHDALVEHRKYINEHGEDMPSILGWRWAGGASVQRSSTEGDNV
jgi:xylulose-5-phosphate/fructose-6-phosphate phosphoketolase